MGFTVTPRGYHSIGTQNHCIMFGRDYVWSVGITGGTAPAQPSGPGDGAIPAPTPGARAAKPSGSRTAPAPAGR